MITSTQYDFSHSFDVYDVKISYFNIMIHIHVFIQSKACIQMHL